MKTPPQPKAPRARVMYDIIFEGQTHDAVIVKDPVAYRKIEGHKSTVGKRVRVTASRVVNIEWECGASNSVDRSCVKLVGQSFSVLPRSKEAQEQLIEQGALAIAKYKFGAKWVKRYFDSSVSKPDFIAESRACFASANLVEKE